MSEWHWRLIKKGPARAQTRRARRSLVIVTHKGYAVKTNK